MNVSLRLFAAAALLGAFGFSTNASAQTYTPATISATAQVSVEATIGLLLSRSSIYFPGAPSSFAIYQVQLLTAMNVSCAPAKNQAFPVVLSTNGDAKQLRESLQLAFAMGRRVRIYSGMCTNFNNNEDGRYPIITALDIL
jgi:hypothetical protein